MQSTACLVLAAQGKIDCKTFLFANVGDDAENPATLQYIKEISKLFADRHNIDIIELQRIRRDGSIETLMSRIVNSKSSISIPVRMSNGAPGNRTCTVDFKIKVIEKWLKNNGFSKDNKANVGIGFSTDEAHRAGKAFINPVSNLCYPLIEFGYSRQDCLNIIRLAGLPQPPKSACWFCPFHRTSEWQRLRRETPHLFKQAIELETMLNERREPLGKDKVWLTPFNRPLNQAIPIESEFLELIDECEDECESGVCFL